MISKVHDDKSMKREDNHHKYSEKVTCVKWKDSYSTVLLESIIDSTDDFSSLQRHEKDISFKTSFLCPQRVKRCNKEMERVDLMGQLTSTYRLDRRSKTRYYLHLSFDLWDMALLNSHIVYGKLTQKKPSHLDFQVTEAKSIIGNYKNWRRNQQIFTMSAILFLRKHNRISLS